MSSITKKILLSYTYVAVWIALSCTLIIYNKYILSPTLFNFPFPITLTILHMAVSSVLSLLVLKLLPFDTPPATITSHLYLTSVVPIAALYALTLALSNSAVVLLSVSFIQMLKALMPVAVYSFAVLLGRRLYDTPVMLNMLVISAGVAVAAYGEATLDVTGVTLQLGAVATEALRLVLVERLLADEGIALNPVTSLYYVAPCCLAFLVVPWGFLELPGLYRKGAFGRLDLVELVVFGGNALCAFGLNLAVFLLVGRTSALTMNVAGVVKNWLLIAFSWGVIRDSVTSVNLVGYGIAFVGVAYYNYVKLEGLKAKEEAEDEERLLDGREGGGDRKGENSSD